MKNTKQGFFTLQKSEIKRYDHKIVGLYSYNLLDHPDFIRAQRIEKRIIRYNMTKARKESEKQQQ